MTYLPKDDVDLTKAFGTMMSIEQFSPYISEIIERIYSNDFSKKSLDGILNRYAIVKIEDIKEELLDLLLVYINLILNDNLISEREAGNVRILKRVFKIKEGDFYHLRYYEVEDILSRQFERIYSDNKIDRAEAILKVELQELFGLSYDQFLELVDQEVEAALQRGANLSDLDTVFIANAGSKKRSRSGGRTISPVVKDLVWNRDGGRCIQCSSTSQLEFCHIIPFSKGGSNTYRNIRLLCGACNLHEV